MEPKELRQRLHDELTFDRLRPVIDAEVDDHALSTVLHRVRKIARDGAPVDPWERFPELRVPAWRHVKGRAPGGDGLYLFVGEARVTRLTFVYTEPSPLRWYTDPGVWRCPAGIIQSVGQDDARGGYVFAKDLDGWIAGPIRFPFVPFVEPKDEGKHLWVTRPREEKP